MSVTSVGRGLAIDEDLEDLLKNVNDEDSCLLVLEVENTSTRQAFEAVAMASDAIGAKVKERIEPNTTVNLLLPIKKIRLSEETVLQPIPLLSSRQFVVGKNMLQPYELSRFWYREELMRAIQLEWREVGSRRNGSCNLRHLPLSDEMFTAFKLSDLPLTVEVSQDGELCFQNEHEHWDVREGRFTDMAISLKNLKGEHDAALPMRESFADYISVSIDRKVTMIAHLEVKPGNGLPMRSNAEIDPTSRNLLIDGTTTVALPTLKAKEELPTALLFSLCFMSKGMFMLDVLLEEMLDKDVTGASRIKARTQHTVCFNVS